MTAPALPYTTNNTTSAGDPHDARSYYADIDRVIEQMNAKAEDYEKAEDFAKGNVREIFAQEWVADILEGTADEYLCNFSGRVVEEAFNRVAIQSIVVTSQDVLDAAHPYATNTTVEAGDPDGMNSSEPDIGSGPDTYPVNVQTPPDPTAVLGHPAEDDASAQTQAAATTPDQPPTTHSDDTLQRVWRRIYRSNDLGNFFPKWIHKTLRCGDAYGLCWPAEKAGQPPLTQVLDPTTTIAIYDDENDDRLLFTARWFETTDNRKRMNLYYEDRLVKLISKTNVAGEQSADYVPYTGTDADEPETSVYQPYDVTEMVNYAGPMEIFNRVHNIPPTQPLPASSAATLLRAPITQPGWPLNMPGGRQPIRHLKTTNDGCYGEPAHKMAYGPQNAINKLIAVQMATADELGFPGRYALQKSTTVDQNAFDDEFDDELPPDSKRADVENKPGVLNLLKDVDTLTQLAAADPDGFLKPMQTYIKFMSFVTATPMSFYDTLGQMPDDATQRENNGPLIMKCNGYKRVMTRCIESFVEDLFAVMGYGQVVAHVQWAPSVRVDDVNGWEVITGKIANGVPWTVAMQEAGYTEAEVAGWAKPSAGFSQQFTMIEQLGQAAAGLAQAVTAEVLDQAAAADLLNTMIQAIKNTPIDASSSTNVSFRG